MKPDSWVCDSCGELITDPVNGLLVWRTVNDQYSDFQLVHKNIDGLSCDPGDRAGFVSSIEMHHLLGLDGQAWLLAFLTPGPLRDDIGAGAQIPDMGQYVDLFRRLQTPWYEEARARFGDDEVQAELATANETQPYLQDTLKAIAAGTLGS